MAGVVLAPGFTWLGPLLPVLCAGVLAVMAAVSLISNRRLRASREALVQELAERKQAEEQLRYQALLLAQTGDAILAMDNDHCVTFWNLAAERLFGITAASALGRRAEDLFEYGEHSGIREEIRAAVASQGAWVGEVLIRLRNGEAFHAETAVRQMQDAGGERIGSIFAIRDITDRKRAEDARRVETARLDALCKLAKMVDASLEDIAGFALEEGVRLCGSEFGFLAVVNPEQTVLRMYAWSEQTRRQCQIARPPRQFPVAEAGIAGEAVRQRRAVMINSYDPAMLPAAKGLPEGHVPLRSLLSVPVFDGDRVAMLACVANKTTPYDETDVRQLTLLMDGAWKLFQLRESQERYRILFEESPVPLLEADLSEVRKYLERASGGSLQHAEDLLGAQSECLDACVRRFRVTGMNREAKNLFHVQSPEELAARLRGYLPEAGMAAYRQALTEFLRGARDCATRVEIRLSSGVRHSLEVRVTREATPDDDWSRVIISLMDFTERRRLEEQLLQSQKMEAIGNLACGVAHDFNNLLTVMIGYLELAANKLPPEHPILAHLLEVRKAGEQATELTRQLLTFSRKQISQPRPVNLNEAVRRAENMLRRLIGEHIQLVLTLDPHVGVVSADPTQIHQVLLNLAVNARDAMPHGGKLEFRTANVFWDEKDRRFADPGLAGPYVQLSVTDTGIGMDESTRARIFEPFFTTKGAGHGTGLGLSTVYGIVRQNGGHIEVLSEPGRGAAFHIYLPRIDAPAAVQEPAQVAVSGGTETVLLAEDDEEVRRLAAECLRAYGYRVHEAANGVEALKVAAHTETIHLLVTDVVMPEVSGPELAAHLMATRPGLKTLFISGYPDSEMAQRGLLKPGAAYLRKPFTPAALALKVREALG